MIFMTWKQYMKTGLDSSGTNVCMSKAWEKELQSWQVLQHTCSLEWHQCRSHQGHGFSDEIPFWVSVTLPSLIRQHRQAWLSNSCIQTLQLRQWECRRTPIFVQANQCRWSTAIPIQPRQPWSSIEASGWNDLMPSSFQFRGWCRLFEQRTLDITSSEVRLLKDKQEKKVSVWESVWQSGVDMCQLLFNEAVIQDHGWCIVWTLVVCEYSCWNIEYFIT